MVDSKFLVITILCYVGIFFVIFLVCCCAWLRYVKNEGKGSRSRNIPIIRGRFYSRTQSQPPAYIPATPSPVYFHHQQSHIPVNYQTTRRDDYYTQPPCDTATRITYVHRYPVVDYSRGTVAEVTTAPIPGNTGFTTVERVPYRETSNCEFSEELSDAASSRFDNDTREDVDSDLDERRSQGTARVYDQALRRSSSENIGSGSESFHEDSRELLNSVEDLREDSLNSADSSSREDMYEDSEVLSMTSEDL